MAEIPDVIADDAPDPDDFEAGETVATTYKGQIAFDHDGERYCVECVSEAYAELCLDDPRQIPYGGPVPSGAEVDCPGYGCGRCLREIEGFTVLHYDGVCHPDSCPDMAARVRDPDRVRDPVEAAVLERDGGDVRVMLKEDFGSHGEAGDVSWIPEGDVLPAE